MGKYHLARWRRWTIAQGRLHFAKRISLFRLQNASNRDYKSWML
jgi:hypothetical protein